MLEQPCYAFVQEEHAEDQRHDHDDLAVVPFQPVADRAEQGGGFGREDQPDEGRDDEQRRGEQREQQVGDRAGGLPELRVADGRDRAQREHPHLAADEDEACAHRQRREWRGILDHGQPLRRRRIGVGVAG